jgi:hypothetical protein
LPVVRSPAGKMLFPPRNSFSKSISNLADI